MPDAEDGHEPKGNEQHNEQGEETTLQTEGELLPRQEDQVNEQAEQKREEASKQAADQQKAAQSTPKPRPKRTPPGDKALPAAEQQQLFEGTCFLKACRTRGCGTKPHPRPGRFPTAEVTKGCSLHHSSSTLPEKQQRLAAALKQGPGTFSPLTGL